MNMGPKFMPYPLGARDSRDCPPTPGFGFDLTCPQCGCELVHPLDATTFNGPYDDRLAAAVALECETNGCPTTIIFGNYKGTGYAHWVAGVGWSKNIDQHNEELRLMGLDNSLRTSDPDSNVG